ncbi:MAG: serine hydrolase [Polyangiaceae bacterium]
MKRALLIALAALAACGGSPPSAPVSKPAAPPPVASTPPAQKPPPAMVIAMTPKELLEKIFTEPHADPAWFQPAFLAQVPASKIDTVTQGVVASSGKLRSVRALTEPQRYELVFEKGIWEATIVVTDGKIEGLLVRPAGVAATTIEEAVAPFRALPGRYGFTVIADGKTLTHANEGDALAVGSSFKLAVLVELRDRIEKQKKLAWESVVKLDPKWKSLPSGMLQDWPAQTPVTVQSLASLMISISDNTATDTLIHLLGRAALGSSGGGQNRPFLTTADMFRLKAKGSDALLERFQKATPAQREKMLDEVEKLPLPHAEDYPKGVTALDVEWFFSPAELCAYMARVHDLPLMGINPGVAKKSDWDRIAYKGGSEPGVINMTSWVTKGSKSYCVSATWNDGKPIDETRFALAYSGVLSFLAKSP